MIKYKGNAKCSCGRKAKWKVIKGSQNIYACNKHKKRLEWFDDPKQDSEHYTEADYQTWLKL